MGLEFLYSVFLFAILVKSNDIKEIKERYDDKCNTPQANCEVTINIKEKMEKTIHVYYELHNVYQNQRMYMKSLSRNQLEGNLISSSDAEDRCDGAAYLREISNFLCID